MGPEGQPSSNIAGFRNWNNRGPTGHAQWYNGGSTTVGSAGITIDHTVTLQGQNISQFGPGPIFYSNNSPAPIAFLNITNNTLINSFVGGMPANGLTVSGCQGAPPTGGTANNPTCGSTSGNTFYQTGQIGGTLGYGADLNCLSPGGVGPATALITYKAIPGSYPISNGSAPSTINEFETDGFNTNQYAPKLNYSRTAQCDNVSASGQVADLAIAGGDGATPIGYGSWSNNYVDVSSQSGGVNSQTIWNVTQVFNNTSVTGSIATSGGTSTLTTTASITPKIGSFVVASNITGCGGTNLACPSIVSGSGTSWVLSSNVGTVTSEAMTIEPLAWCTTPITLSGRRGRVCLDGWGTGTAYPKFLVSAECRRRPPQSIVRPRH